MTCCCNCHHGGCFSAPRPQTSSCFECWEYHRIDKEAVAQTERILKMWKEQEGKVEAK